MIVFLCALFVGHFIGDFLLQTDWMALNKSKSTADGIHALTVHAFVYSLTVTLALAVGLGVLWFDKPLQAMALFLVYFGHKVFAFTFFTHWLTDYFTSRATSKLWFFDRAWTGCTGHCNPDVAAGPNFTCWKYVEGKRHWFFVVIGLDQLIHQVTLLVTVFYILPLPK